MGPNFALQSSCDFALSWLRFNNEILNSSILLQKFRVERVEEFRCVTWLVIILCAHMFAYIYVVLLQPHHKPTTQRHPINPSTRSGHWPINRIFGCNQLFCASFSIYSKSLKDLDDPQRNRNERYFIETSVKNHYYNTLISILSTYLTQKSLRNASPIILEVAVSVGPRNNNEIWDCPCDQ